MKQNTGYKSLFITTVSYLHVLLFVYAAVSKLLDFENFRVQLGQSPLLNAFADYIVWIIPILELALSVILTVPRFRTTGLLASMGLMIMFSVYIFLILHYSSYIPCSCGGILEQMDWNEHLYFNLTFALLSFLAVQFSGRAMKRMAIRSIAVIIASIMIILGMFFGSEMIIHKHNNFIRNYTPITVELEDNQDLGYNGYYFAGKDHASIYLGNHTSPGLIVELDTKLSSMSKHPINIADTLYRFLNVQLRVQPPYFYLFDGTVPCVFKGKLQDMRAVLQSDKAYGFTKAVIVDSTQMVIRTISDSRENLLATLSIKEGKIIRFAPELLEKQIDGLFDTDGTLQYSEQLQQFVYLYYYRNQYVVADRNLTLLYRANTIDTTSKAKIRVEYLKQRNEKKFSAPPLMVNRISTLHRNLLFVNSSLPGRHDTKKMWERASVIDVYDISTRTYVMSFYIDALDGKKISDLMVTDTHVFALIGTHIVSYRIGSELKMHYKK